MKDGVERLGEKPCPQEGTARPDQIVHDDAASREPVEGFESRDDLRIGQVVEEKPAGHVVECTVPEWRVLDIRAGQAHALVGGRDSPRVVERGGKDVGCRDAQIESA